MQLSARKLAKTEKSDLLVCTRDDGSSTQVAMPRQGVLPHDLLHFVVETALPFRHGFLSQVAGGAGIGFDAGQSYVLGPARHVMESAQVESIVEALQSQLWAGAFDPHAFLEGVRLACESRGQPAPALAPLDFKALLFDRARELHAQWMAVPQQQSMTLRFERRAALTPG